MDALDCFALQASIIRQHAALWITFRTPAGRTRKDTLGNISLSSGAESRKVPLYSKLLLKCCLISLYNAVSHIVRRMSRLFFEVFLE